MFRRLALIAVAALGLTFTLAACQSEGPSSPVAGTSSVQPDAQTGSCTTPPGTANTGC